MSDWFGVSDGTPQTRGEWDRRERSQRSREVFSQPLVMARI
jgi:hypothetical protein